ncbi:conserved hypothetical protein [Echinococcus multilocularis]|uniref:Uncharacterized protein n=1 Tax=Echinococcus multilocularis TaxID=6211 RepID=A0A068XUM5_ECHMU|nr:conserved hypothetical protein [Echinococcus multilocularis]
MLGGDALLNLQQLVENYAENIISTFSATRNGDLISSSLHKLTETCSDVAEFYSNPQNWDSFNCISRIDEGLALLPNTAISDIIEHINMETSRQLLQVALNDVNNAERDIEHFTKSIQDIQNASLNRILQFRHREALQIIPLGRLRSWACDVMKARRRSLGEGGSTIYASVARCARLRRRLSRLFSLARAAHALIQRLAKLQHPELACLEQDLMRIRLQLTLRLKQNGHEAVGPDGDTDAPALCSNAEQLFKRFKNVGSTASSSVIYGKIYESLQRLAENMSDLIMVLSQETSGEFLSIHADRRSLGLSTIINIDEPFNREDLQALVERSLESFCNFYITSVAPDVSPHEADALLAQLSRSDEELEEISQSDTECMMDAFDIFDSFIEQNTPPSRPKEEAAVGAKDDISTPTSRSPSPADMDIESIPAEADNSITENVANESRHSDEPCDDATLNQPSGPEGVLLPQSPSVENGEVDLCGKDAVEESEQEEGEIVDDDNTHQDAEPLEEGEEDDSGGDIDQTEEAIMREWAPVAESKARTKLAYTVAVQKALNDAMKSCRRELSVVVALGAFSGNSGRSTVAEMSTSTPSATATAKSVERGIRNAVARSHLSSRRSAPVAPPSYSRAAMLNIREKIQSSLLRQKQSKQVYRLFFGKS